MPDLLSELFQVEPFLPRTVNNIPGPTLDGNLINLVIFIIIGLFMVGYAYYLWVKNQLKWEKVGQTGILVLLAFWVLLEVVRSFSYLTYFSEDQARFGGKTLSQKRDQLQPPGFYSFVEFTEKRITRSTPVAVRSNLDQYTGMMWDYYTAPLNQVAEADAQYIIGLNVAPPKSAEQFLPVRQAGVPNFWVAKR